MPPTDPQTQQSSRSSAENNPRSSLRKRVLDLNTLAYVLVLVFVILILRHHLIQNEALRLFFATRFWSSLTRYIPGHRTLGISYGPISKIVNVQCRATLGDLFFYMGSWCNHHIRFIMTIPSALVTTCYSLAKVLLSFISSLTHIPSRFLGQLSLKRVLIAIFYAIQNWLIPVIKLAMICIATSIIACTTISESFISQHSTYFKRKHYSTIRSWKNLYDTIMQNNPETDDRNDLYKEQDKKRDAAMESSLAILARAAQHHLTNPASVPLPPTPITA